MRKKLATKICAVAMCVAMVGTLAGCGNESGNNSSTPDSSTPEESQGGQESTPEESQGEEETPSSEYDFGGQVIKVYGNQWNALNPEETNPEAIEKRDYAATIEQKYNVKFEYTKPEGYDGYNLSDVLISSITSGKPAVDIIDMEPDAIVKMITGGYVEDITDHVQELEVGSLYTDAVTLNGRTYGMTFDNIGDTYVLIYSRKYLKDIGMEETPTDWFMQGKWSWSDCKEYLTQLKAKLPEGVYPISVHYSHWAYMCGGANGVPTVSNDGKINITDERWYKAMEFYKELIDAGLASPVTWDPNEEEPVGNDGPEYYYQTDYLNTKHVITRAESWELNGEMSKKTGGDWGIVYWPWGDDVTCDGDYTTLSDNYKIAQAYWGSAVVIKGAAERTGIDTMTLFKIMQDYYALCNPVGDAARHQAWVDEQNGVAPEVGYENGDPRAFCTKQDIELFDWGHTRVVYDWAWPFNKAGYVRMWMMSAEIVDSGDGKSVAESYYQAGLEKMKEAGLTQ